MTESEIQKLVFSNLRRRAYPGAVFWHVPNDPRSRRKAGYLAGIHDVHILHCGKFYSMELKTPEGHPSEDQLEFRDRVNAAGGYSFVPQGYDQAIAGLVSWNIIRPEAV